MKKMYKIATVLLAFCFLLGSVPMSVKAEDYKYQVTIFSGKQGSFSGTAGLVVKGADYSVSNTADAIVIKDLNPGDTVSFEARSGAVALDKDSKYYVQGIRISGRDNNAAVENSSFEVTGDQEYVVAYGIKGDQVAYTINYQDANGNKLADSQTFYGNVGDKPVVAYTYIDGYTPEYRNLTKTLSANAAENVFTFNYLPYETVTVTTPGQTITNTTEQTVTVPGGTTTTTGGTTGTTGGTTGTTGGTTGGTADPDGECKNDPVDQPAGSNCADGGNDHTDGSALQKRCCVCKLDQCIYHPGVHRNDATDGDAVYDIMSVSEPEACLHGYGERRMAIMNEVHDIMIFADPLFCFYFIFFTAVDSISLIRFSWFTSEAPGS